MSRRRGASEMVRCHTCRQKNSQEQRRVPVGRATHAAESYGPSRDPDSTAMPGIERLIGAHRPDRTGEIEAVGLTWADVRTRMLVWPRWIPRAGAWLGSLNSVIRLVTRRR